MEGSSVNNVNTVTLVVTLHCHTATWGQLRLHSQYLLAQEHLRWEQLTDPICNGVNILIVSVSAHLVSGEPVQHCPDIDQAQCGQWQ